MLGTNQENGFDRFFLNYLQSVRSNTSWYYNQKYLGKGGNGTAFLVTCSSGQNFGLQLVLKVFHKISNQRRREAFLEEIAHLRSFNHPAIVKLYDEGEYRVQDRTYLFAVMEYVPLNAKQLMLSNRINRLRALRIILNCLSALNCIHNSDPPVIHRDIKPENILISETGAKIADFGLAKVEESSSIESNFGELDAEESLLQQSQWPAMPRCYRTPELIARARETLRNGEPRTEISPSSDIFQLGTVFYELLTSYNPQRNPENILDDLQLDIREIRGEMGQELFELVNSMLNIQPENRPDALECLERLNRIHKNYCNILYGVTTETL